MGNDIKKEIKWTSGNGKEVVVTVSLTTERHVGTNEWTSEEMTRPCCKISTEATADGVDVGGLGYMSDVKDGPTLNGTVVVARIGNLGISETNRDRVQAARDEIEGSDYVQDWRAKERAADKIEDEYYAHTQRVSDMMDE